jgi:hypothetical protein
VFAHDSEMVQLVARNVEGQPAHRAAVAVYATVPGPRSGRPAPQEHQARRPGRSVLREEILQGAALEQEAVGKDALIVDEVPEHLFERPFPRAAGEAAVRGFREGAEEGRRLGSQLRQSFDGIVARDNRDVCTRVVSVLACMPG